MGSIKPRRICHHSTYEYFVVYEGLAQADAVQALDDGGLHPHLPARLYIRSDARRKAIRTLARPVKIPGRLPSGLKNRAPSYDAVNVACAQGDINEAVLQCYQTARNEWAELTGTSDDNRQPTLKWRFAAGCCAAEQAGNTTPATAWRILGKRVDEAARLLDKRQPGSEAATRLGLHQQITGARRLPKTIPDNLRKQLGEKLDN